MGRTARKNMENSSFFHIMVQGINKEYIFKKEENKKKYLQLIYCKSKYIQIMSYCIMDNHAHILIKIDDIGDMRDWMKKVNTSYAIYYNKRNDRVGYVFRERYKVQPIRNEKHLYLCVEYIHNNPVKAGICNKKDEYEFSSYSEIYRKNQNKIQREIGKILEQSVVKLIKPEEKQEEFELLDEQKENKEEKCQEMIQKFLQRKGITRQELKKQEYLIEIIKILKEQSNISYRIMEKYLQVNREKLRRLFLKTF